jgi:Tfp pilus assembly protein PilO
MIFLTALSHIEMQRQSRVASGTHRLTSRSSTYKRKQNVEGQKCVCTFYMSYIKKLAVALLD